MDPTQLFIAQRLRSVESSINAAAARAPLINNLAELMRSGNISVPPELRAVVRGLPCYRNMNQAIAKRARQLVDKDLAELRARLPAEGQTHDAFIADLQRAYGKLQIERWSPLRGHHPQVLTHAYRSGVEIISDHKRNKR